VLDWIRRKDPACDKELKEYLFTDKPVAHEGFADRLLAHESSP
jgi:hypothetical protein